MTPPARVLVCDDVADIRALLRLSLRSDPTFDVVGEAANGLEAVAEATRLQPDLVVLDLSMPVMDGLEALPLIRRAAPAAKVLVLSGFRGREVGPAASGSGADAYLEKGASPARIVAVLRALYDGFTRASACPGS